MQDKGKATDASGQEQGASKDQNSRPQQAGEAGTTRFGMEEGDNTDIPATGDGTRED